jgi:hypothetical protein
MKKIIFAVLAALVVFGFVQAGPAAAGDEQLPFQVSPRTWVLGASGIEVVDIHYAVSLSSVDADSLKVTLLSDGVPIDDPYVPVAVFADDRGELVVKFVPDPNVLLDGDTLTVQLTGYFTDLSEIDETFPVEVKDAGFLKF